MFADVVHEAAETEAPYMTDEPNRAFENECRVKVFMQSGISLLAAWLWIQYYSTLVMQQL